MSSVEQLREPGEHLVDAEVTCAITRFGLRNPLALVSSRREFGRVARIAHAGAADRLLRSAFLVEDPRTWYSLSFWSGVPKLSAHVPEHIDAANRVLGKLAYRDGIGPELWTTKWRLMSVSNNLNWGDFDLRQVISRQRDAGASR